jgi:hypothetical protein
MYVVARTEATRRHLEVMGTLSREIADRYATPKGRPRGVAVFDF